MTQRPRISVPVLYPLGFRPGFQENWREVLNECFRVALTHLHEQIADSGWRPDQGEVIGPTEEIEGEAIPTALGFAPRRGEQPQNLVKPVREIGPNEIVGGRIEGGEPGAQMVRMAPQEFSGVEAYAVFQPNDDGRMAPSVTRDRHAFLIFEGGDTALEAAIARDDARVVRVRVLWDPKRDGGAHAS